MSRSQAGQRWRGFEAPYANLACVEAATRLPFEEGLAFEREGLKPPESVLSWGFIAISTKVTCL